MAYRNARRLAPSEPRWAYYLAILHVDEGRLEEAAHQLADVVTLRPEDLAGLIRAGQVQLDLGNPAQAEPFFAKAAAVDPNSAAAHAGLGRIASAQGDVSSAIEHFQRALELDPRASALRYPFGLAYRQLGQLDQARQHLEARGDQRAGFADPWLDQLATIAKRSAADVALRQAADPANYPATEMAGFVVNHLGDTPGAGEYLQASLEQSEQLGKQERARIHYLVAVLRKLHDEVDEAIEHLRAALDLQPDFTEAELDLARVLAGAGQTRAAGERYSAILERHPEHLAALEERATIWIRLGDDARAAEDLRRRLALGGEQAKPRLHLAMVLHRLGQRDAAQDLYASALELELPPEDRATAHTNLATLASGRGDGDAAIEHLSAAWKLTPDDKTATLRLADALGRADRFEEAAQHYARVVAEDPRHEAARLGEISASIFSERYQVALDRLLAAHSALPDSQVVAHLLARFFVAAPSETLRNSERALNLAQAVFSQRQTLLHGETLAMALAASGRFSEAAKLQGNLLAAAESRRAERTAERLRSNLERYRAGQVCCSSMGVAVLLPTAEVTSDS